MRAQAIAVLLAAASIASVANGYETKTHSKISGLAAKTSSLAYLELLPRLGLIGDVDNGKLKFQNVMYDELTIRELIEYGSVYEDDRAMTQALYHFFNPRNGAGLLIDGSQPGLPSPDWILTNDQHWSYTNARGAFFDALTSTLGPVHRNKSWGRTFQSLGHIIHHLQDMAQPEHVRNDPHCDSPICALLDPFFKDRIYWPSLFEQWTKEHPPAEDVFTAYSPVFSASDPNGFTTPRKFWTTTEGNGTGGNGIAEYTHRGFFSKGSPSASSAFPEPQGVAVTPSMTVQQLCQGAVPACDPAIASNTGVITFFANTVTDSLRPQYSKQNSRAVSYSLLDADLKTINATQTFTLNRFNIQATHEFLIPRAVAYSAGLINYFFRGKLEITLPDEGVYAVAAHEPEGGFSAVKLKLKNATPAGTDGGGTALIEPMGSGQLVAVAKFHRNNCYTPTLAGEYGAPDPQYATVAAKVAACRSADEEIVVSDPVAISTTVGGGMGSTPAGFTFTFPAAIPFSASDLYLQVVFRGQLGAEADAVAVGTKDVFEPTYQYYENREIGTVMTYPYYKATTWEEDCVAAYPAATLDQCRDYQSKRRHYSFKACDQSQPFAAVARMQNLAKGQYGRFAYLTEQSSGPLCVLTWQRSPSSPLEWDPQPVWSETVFGAIRNQMDSANNMTPQQYQLYRDAYFYEGLYPDMSTYPALTLQPSLIAWPSPVAE